MNLPRWNYLKYINCVLRYLWWNKTVLHPRSVEYLRARKKQFLITKAFFIQWVSQKIMFFSGLFTGKKIIFEEAFKYKAALLNKKKSHKREMNMAKLLPITLLFLLVIAGCRATEKKTDILRNRIEHIITGKNAVVGVSIIGKDSNDTLSLNGNNHFPMQSVYKFHIALAVLSEVDKGNLSLDSIIVLNKYDLLPEDLYSPLRDENLNGGSFTIARLIQYAVSQSDNIACDVLIRLLGTPKTIEDFCKKNNIRDIAIAFNEKDMQSKWENMFQNWTTPIAANQTLKMFYDNENKLMSKDSFEFIWKTMKETTTGQNRIKGQLPENTVVAHKTGWSGTNKDTGITDAVNDIGIVFLPDGGHFFISVFITNSKENLETNEKIIADIAKTVYDFYSNVPE